MLPIYELKINEEVNDSAEVSFVALVDEPAIKKDFVAFKFVEPSKGEHETEFIPRCIEYIVNEGKDTEQATAICYSIWEQHFAESYNDYPKEAIENAKIALRWAEENGWGDCLTVLSSAPAQMVSAIRNYATVRAATDVPDFSHRAHARAYRYGLPALQTATLWRPAHRSCPWLRSDDAAIP